GVEWRGAGVGEGPEGGEGVWDPQVGPLPHAARVGAGDAPGDRAAVASWLDHRGRRDGPLVAVPGRAAPPGRAVRAGRAVEHDGPRLGRRGARTGRPGATSEAGVRAGARVGSVLAPR